MAGLEGDEDVTVLLDMRLLNPSQLHWLWLAIIPVVLWLFRRVFLESHSLRLALVGNGSSPWKWMNQPGENDIVKTSTHPQNDDRETSIADSSGKAAPSPLELAAAEFGAGLRADGPDAGSAEEQWKFLEQWARSQGLILPAGYALPVRSDTSEHDVRFDEITGRWFKYTIPGLCGFSVDWDGRHEPRLRMARPAEYLLRLCRQNEIFADNIELVGLLDEPGGGWRIITSQPDIVGEPPSRLQILEGMKNYGFSPLDTPGPNNAPAFRCGGVVVWDAHPGNFVMTPDDVLVPIDLIITEPPSTPSA